MAVITLEIRRAHEHACPAYLSDYVLAFSRGLALTHVELMLHIQQRGQDSLLTATGASAMGYQERFPRRRLNVSFGLEAEIQTDPLPQFAHHRLGYCRDSIPAATQVNQGR